MQRRRRCYHSSLVSCNDRYTAAWRESTAQTAERDLGAGGPYDTNDLDGDKATWHPELTQSAFEPRSGSRIDHAVVNLIRLRVDADGTHTERADTVIEVTP